MLKIKRAAIATVTAAAVVGAGGATVAFAQPERGSHRQTEVRHHHHRHHHHNHHNHHRADDPKNHDANDDHGGSGGGHGSDD